MATPTGKEFWEARRRWMKMAERAKTIGSDLRATGDAISIEAAEIIEHLQESVAHLRSDLNEEVAEGQRQSRSAYSQGRFDEREES